MEDFKKLLKKYWRFGLIAVIALILLTVISATGGDIRQAGSSYHNAANGYGAWYKLMVDRGVKIDRWRKSFSKLAEIYEDREGITLLQVNSQLERWRPNEQQIEWVKSGNTLVVLGVTAPAWDIPFRTELNSTQGNIKIETTRRFKAGVVDIGLPSNTPSKVILSDKAGSALVQFNLEAGRIIVATTPYLAANAYQDSSPNYELLAELVTQDRQEILVDEYIHGYIDRKPKSQQKPGDLPQQESDEDSDKLDSLVYLSRTPFIVVFLNLLLGLSVLIWQQNRRLGKLFIPKSPEIENSEAYIQALGGVLRQANSSEFVIQNIGKSQQLSWQRKLGLGGDRLVSHQILLTAWENRTNLPTEDLRFILQLMTEARRLTPNELNVWLAKLQNIDRQLGNYEL